MKVEISKKLLYHSAKQAFKNLREQSPFFYTALGQEVFVTKLFFEHIAHAKNTRRSVKDLSERLLLIPFAQRIFKEGILVEERDSGDRQFFRITLNIHDQKYSLVLVKKGSQLFLLSCFIDFNHYKKKDPS